MPRFIAEEIQVTAAPGGLPSSFEWGARRYEIIEILSMKRSLDFRRAWWRRKHRDDYRVRTDSGDTFKIYFHRGPGRRYWVLCEMVDD